MASIIEIGGKWRAQVRKRGRSIARTFRTKTAAQEWARAREAEIERGDHAAPSGDVTVSAVVKKYRQLREDAGRAISDFSTEHYTLKQFDRDLGPEKVGDLTPERMVKWAAARSAEGAGPYTINCDLGKLGTVLRYTAPTMKRTFPDVVGSARPMLSYLRLIGGGGIRERRPTQDELERILAAIDPRYCQAIMFDAMVGLRRGELVSIGWEDIDRERRLIRVMRKHPRKGKVEERVPVLPKPWALLESIGWGSGRVFPFHPQTLTKAWTETCRALSIPDLQLRDLRHEGISRMFEDGMNIPQVALVSGHKKWETLKRYTNLRPEDITRHAAGSDRDNQQRHEHQQSETCHQRKS